MEQVVEIHARYEGAADAALGKLARRAAKYGQTIAWAKEPFVVTIERKPIAGKKYVIEQPMIRYTLTGEAPSVGPYKFLAAIELIGGECLVSGGETDGLGHSWKGECQHCGKNRDRRYGFVVEHKETGERTIVGKACLRDFVGQDVPAGVIAAFQYLPSFAGAAEEEGWGGYGGEWTEDTLAVIAAARAAIRLWGWIPNSQADHVEFTTAGSVRLLSGMVRGKDALKQRDALLAELEAGREDYFATAAKIIAWAAEYPAVTDYERNLRIACKLPYVTQKTFGLAISASAAYDRQQARILEREKAAAEREAAKADDKRNVHFGKVGERVECELRIVGMRGTPDRGFGEGVLHTFYGPEGQLLKWFTSKGIGHPGDVIRAKFTVKKHGEYNGMKETMITRLAKQELVRRAA